MIHLLTISTLLITSQSTSKFSPRPFTYFAADTSPILRAQLSCCASHVGTDPTTEAHCNNELGSKCVWVATDDSVYPTLPDGNQCVGASYYNCKKADINACCNGCCGCETPQPPISVPPNILNPPEGITGPECSTTGIIVVGPERLPEPVSDQIDDAREAAMQINPKCKPKTNCWTDYADFEYGKTHGPNYDYSTVTVTAAGVELNNGECCYSYISSWGGGRTDCTGNSPEQSHLMFDVDCDPSDYTVVSGAQGYAVDASTCYAGIKIDEGCAKDKDCNYEICIRYADTDLFGKFGTHCPTAESWVMEKAATVFSFNALDGVPSCRGGPQRWNFEYMHVKNGFEVGYKVFGVSYVWLVLMAIIMVLGGFVGYRFCCNGGEYEKINGNKCNGYSTFSSV